MLGTVRFRQPAIIMVAIPGHHFLQPFIGAENLRQLSAQVVMQCQHWSVTVDDFYQLIAVVIDKTQLVIIHVPVFSQQPALGVVVRSQCRQGKIFLYRGIAVAEDIPRLAPAQGKIRVVGVDTVGTGGR
ncbi:hypothetical protein [Photorhabdus heterorhabditis]|uniref:hypothetical protein n=1 Tax=Photorhabdus heterorhabditis TaxID=880156 RepID=UPI0026604ABA|nr:hypothetical protein [Photorhabdus heterorhabditis]